MKNKNTKILILAGLAIVIVIALASSLTYAFMKPKDEGSNVTDVVINSCAKIKLSDEGVVNLGNSYPMSKNRALNTTPYKFTVTGNCEGNTGYSLYLATLTTNTLAASNIAYIITETGTKNIIKQGTLGSLTNQKSNFSASEINEYNIGVQGTVNEIYLLHNEALPASGVTYDLYLYVDSTVSDTATMNKTFKAGIAVKSYEIKYWNAAFDTIHYAYPNTPVTTYGSVDALRTGYGTANFDSKPYYIKTTTERQACLYYNNKEFCMSLNYWDTDGATTKEKLKTDMESALGVPTSSCTSDSGSEAYCNVSSFSCTAYSRGDVACRGGGSCDVYVDGVATCY